MLLYLLFNSFLWCLKWMFYFDLFAANAIEQLCLKPVRSSFNCIKFICVDFNLSCYQLNYNDTRLPGSSKGVKLCKKLPVCKEHNSCPTLILNIIPLSAVFVTNLCSWTFPGERSDLLVGRHQWKRRVTTPPNLTEWNCHITLAIDEFAGVLRDIVWFCCYWTNFSGVCNLHGRK